MGPILLRMETGVPGENLRCLVKSSWTILFSHETKVTLISQNRNLVTVVRDTCTTTVPPAPLVLEVVKICENDTYYLKMTE